MNQYSTSEIQIIRERLRLYYNVRRSTSSNAYTFRSLIRDIAPLIPEDSDLNQFSFDGNYIFKEDGFVNFINRRQNTLKPDAISEILSFLEEEEYITREELSAVRKFDEFQPPMVQASFLKKPSKNSIKNGAPKETTSLEGEFVTEPSNLTSKVQLMIFSKRKRTNVTKTIHLYCDEYKEYKEITNEKEVNSAIVQSKLICQGNQTKPHQWQRRENAKLYIGTIVKGENQTMLLLEYSLDGENFRSDNLSFDSKLTSFFSHRTSQTYLLSSLFNRRITQIIRKVLLEVNEWFDLFNFHYFNRWLLEKDDLATSKDAFVFDNFAKEIDFYKYSSISTLRQLPMIQTSNFENGKEDNKTSNELSILKGLPQNELDSIFMKACEDNDPYLAFEALLSGANINSISQTNGFCALHWAAQHKSTLLLDVVLCDRLENEEFENSFLSYFLFQHGELNEIKSKWRLNTSDLLPLVLSEQGQLPSRCIDGVKIVPKTDRERRIALDFCRILQNELRACARSNIDLDFVFFNDSENGHFANIGS